MKTLKNTLALFLLFVVFSSSAQDYIHKKNREILKVKIVEISSDEVKFKDFDNPNYPIFSLEKEKIAKVELEGGDIMEFKIKDSFNDPDYYTGQSKNALKVSFTGFFFNQTTFFYERSLSPSTSIEGGLTIIGAGFDMDDMSSRGVGLRFGYKLKRSPDFYLSKMRYAHILKGGYVKPEIILTSYSQADYSYNHATGGYDESNRSDMSINGAFMINFGKQSVFNDQFLVDYYTGIGFGFSEFGGYNGGFIGGSDFPLAFTAGLNIGLVWKDKKDRNK
jgi:hypothetical protein